MAQKSACYKLGIWDVDGTMYPLKGGSFREIERDIDDRVDTFIAKRLSVTLEQAQETRKALREKYGKDLGAGLEEEFGIGREEYFNECWDIDPQRHMAFNQELVEALGDIDMPMALLSNAPAAWVSKVVEFLKVGAFFKFMRYGDGDIKKPDSRAYLEVTERFGVEPSDAIMIEDDLKFLRKAKEIGMTTIFVGETDDPAADYVVSSACQAVKLLRRLEEPLSLIANETD